MKKLIKTMMIPALAVAAILVLSAIPTSEDLEIYDKVVRLHVLANSDSEEDQALKLKVRDGILDTVSKITEDCESKEEAERELRENIEDLISAAENTLRENGSDASVTVEIGNEKYPTREYGELRLPAGTYCSVRVNIGEAEGENWWCVLFPPLCTGSAVKIDEELVEAGFTPDQVKVITESKSPKYKLKFKLLEIIGSIFY